ncbi:MAG: abortive infection protein [Lachnospiraceae bacterium]|jgi:predicted transcriptional regulator of viral defense system|nr:abortive infection protein [Lachnospiraceae bacterium]
MDSIWSKIEKVAEENNGFIKTSAVEAAGVSRPMLRKYMKNGRLEQIRKGLYICADDLADEFAMLQLQSTKAIFSYGTALYLWGLSDRIPHKFDVTIPQGTNISRLKRDNPNIRCHYVKREVYDMGISEVRSPQGAMVRLYDKERCICDLIRDKDKVDIQIYTQAIKEYFNTKPDKRKLLKYSRILGVEAKVRIYMEVL